MRRRRSFKTAPPMVKILRLLGFIVSLIIQNYTTANGKIHHHKFVVSTSLSLSLSPSSFHLLSHPVVIAGEISILYSTVQYKGNLDSKWEIPRANFGSLYRR
jgi:hypothetical protein